MKKFVTVLALLGAVASCSTSCSYAADVTAKDTGVVSSTYEPKADLTTIGTGKAREVKVAIGKRSVTSQAIFSYPGKSPSRPKEVTFRLTTVNPERVWATVESFIYFKASDKVVKVPVQREVGDIGGTSFETLVAQLPVDTFATIFSAKALTITLQHKDNSPFVPSYQENYPFNEASLAPFQELLKSIPAAK